MTARKGELLPKLQQLLELQVPKTRIAAMLGIHRNTVLQWSNEIRKEKGALGPEQPKCAPVTQEADLSLHRRDKGTASATPSATAQRLEA